MYSTHFMSKERWNGHPLMLRQRIRSRFANMTPAQWDKQVTEFPWESGDAPPALVARIGEEYDPKPETVIDLDAELALWPSKKIALHGRKLWVCQWSGRLVEWAVCLEGDGPAFSSWGCAKAWIENSLLSPQLEARLAEGIPNYDQIVAAPHWNRLRRFRGGLDDSQWGALYKEWEEFADNTRVGLQCATECGST